MAVCPSCHRQVPDNDRYCGECGSKVEHLPPPQPPASSAGGVLKDNFIHGSTVDASTQVENRNAGGAVIGGGMVFNIATPAPPDPSLIKGEKVKCQLCGKWLDKYDSFTCRKCGRDHLCLHHQDYRTFWCVSCAENERQGVPQPSLATQARVPCPICGRKVEEAETFRCKSCGRESICLTHQDSTSFLCGECQSVAQLKSEREKLEGEERERLSREREELARQVEMARADEEARKLKDQEEAKRSQERFLQQAEAVRQEKARSMLPPLPSNEQMTVVVGAAQTVPSSEQPAQTRTECGLEMVFVEGGAFLMGSSTQPPVHQVEVGSFRISKYPVTQKQWEEVMGSNPSERKGQNLPVENVDWNEASYFLARLSKITGENYRLPTEAEWEFAARGGNSGRGCQFAGSDNADEVAWHNQNSGRTTKPVGQKKCNELGLHDMSGNVFEWCQDWFGSEYYASSARRDPKGPAEGSKKVIRGGSSGGSVQGAAVYARYSAQPTSRGGNLGFRVVCGM